ncbi:MAG: metallophosphoesterase family protein [Cyclobacteriaceae bacterium]
MPIAVLYDIHGNLPALEAVIAEVGQLEVDEIIVGGDVVVGPMSKECLELLLNIDNPIKFIYGNCEVAVLDVADNKPLTNLPQNVVEDIFWTTNSLSAGQLQEIRKWPKIVVSDIPGIGKTLFCHATPRNENEIFTILTVEEKLLPIFNSCDADIVICGHTHMQFDRMVGSKRIVNAGSVGMPFGKTGAYWLYIDTDFHLKCTTYNLNLAEKSILQTGYPHPDDFIKSITTPQSEETMLEIFGNAELH